MNFKTQNKNKSTSKLPIIDSSYISKYDYERIKKNAIFPSKEESFNEEIIKKEQENDKMAKAKALKEKIINYDLKHPKINYSEMDLENIEKKNNLIALAQKIMDNNEDCVKEMEKLCIYAKVATIRDKQLEEQKKIEKIYKKKEEKLDIMMELERLKELKFQQEKENKRKKLNRDGSLVIIEQIADKEKERIKQKELIEKEQKIMLQQIKDLQEKEIREAERIKLKSERMAKEIEKANKINALNKQKKKIRRKRRRFKNIKI